MVHQFNKTEQSQSMGIHKVSKQEEKWFVDRKGVKKEIIEVWESFNGDLYFITDKKENGDIFCFARLYSMPEFAEWGNNNINYLKEQYGGNKLWKVSKENWGNIDTYEKGLLKTEG